MAGEKVDKIAFKSYIMASNPKATEAQVTLLWNNYQTTGSLPKGFESLLKPNICQNKTSSVFGAGNTCSINPIGFERTALKPPAVATIETPIAQVSDQNAVETSINFLGNSLNNALQSFTAQSKNEGFVSKGYNSIKEVLKSDLSKSAVARTLYAEQTGVYLMDRANKGDLTKKEYYDSKMNLLMEMIPGANTMSEADKAILKAKYSEFSPEKLNEFVDKVKNCSDDEYKQLAQMNQDSINAEKKPSRFLLDNKQVPNIAKADKSYKMPDGDELIKFEEVFFNERSKTYKKENIEEFTKQENQFALVNSTKNSVDEIHKQLDSSLSLVKGNNQGAVSPDIANASNKRLETSLSTVLSSVYGGDSEKINARLKQLEPDGLVSFENGEIKVSPFAQGMKSQILVGVGEKFLSQTDENYKKLLGGKTFESHQKDYTDAYFNAYGNKNGKELSQAFANDQEGAVQYAKMGVQGAGMIMTIAGAAFPPLMVGGMALATYGGTALDAANEASRDGGMSEEAKARLKKEAIVDTAFLGSGFLAGSLGNGAKAALLAKNCPKLLAYASELGADATVGLLSNLVITGDLDLKGESVGQAMSLITGIIAHKKSGIGANTKPDSGVPNVTTKVDPKKFGLDVSADVQTKVEANVNKLHKDVTELSKPIKESFVNSFGKIEGVSVQQRVKDLSAVHEKTYRRYKKAESNIKELEESLKTENSPEKIAQINAEIVVKKTYISELINNNSALSEHLGDSFGQRIIFSKPTPENIEKSVQELIKQIESGDLVITEIENYAVGKDGFYYNQSQVDRLAAACRANGVEVKYTEGFKDSGYTTTQMNVKYKNGVVAELQVRGSEVHATAESEHILYDIREGKDITRGNKEFENVLAPVYDAAKKLDSDKGLKSEFEKYLKSYYQYKRDLELGKSASPPALDPRLPKDLDMDNIIRINNLLHPSK